MRADHHGSTSHRPRREDDAPLIVLKFGGSVLTDEHSIRLAVHEIYRWKREGWRVVAVVSALYGTTDRLLGVAEELSHRPSPYAEAALLSTGELRSASLLGLHLDRAGIDASVMMPGAAGLLAEGDPLDADPIRVDVAKLRRTLDEHGVVVFPGYVAADADGRPVVLGRGGSDLTALFLAHQLGASRCRLVKDVDGMYEWNPAKPGPRPRRYRVASWDDVLATDGSIVQHKAGRMAKALGLHFEIARINQVEPTRVGGDETVLTGDPVPSPRLRVALLGCGSVGACLLDSLRQMHERFDVVGVAVRDVASRRDDPLLAPVLTNDAVGLAGSGVDVVVEVMGGLEPAGAAIEGALRSGACVVTANKALLAERGRELEALAESNGDSLLGSASVGGVAPILEALARHAERDLVSVRGVLNGTTNCVLDAVARGMGFAEAVAEAQRLGFAEADPSRDLGGLDAADKLRVIALRAGLGEVPADGVACEGLTGERVEAAMRSLAPGDVLRHVGVLSVGEAGIEASVSLLALKADDPLARVRDEHNLAVLGFADGSSEPVAGKGAGGWPTSESVLADLLSLLRDRASCSCAKRPEECAVHA